MVHREVTEYTGLNLDLLRVSLPFHFVACFQFLTIHHAKALEHLNAGVIEVAFKYLWTRFLHVKSSLGCFFHPLVAIAVTVEADGLAGPDVLTQNFEDGVEGRTVASAFESFLQLWYAGINAFLEFNQCFCHRTVQGYHSRGTVGFAADGTELEAVAREGKGRCAVAVGVVDK